ncbi:STT3 domain-containing protein [Sulfurospirillum arcachonense]|uniref:STT3 domain-containing protein n=1 Tax=Sulfurospirillum arcachonense TaxID=57666 RepID=UPI0004B1F047|nr:STT3 domain-containing protein [Sulfurospirillum arcachonense]
MISNKQTIFYILIAFTFSVAIRLIWVYQFSDYDAFMWNNQFMINTNDGYYWAEGARDILNWDFSEFARSPVNTAGSQLTAFFAYILPFSFETIILYMPVILSSLIVIPMILIAQSLKRVEFGFVAALLASIAWSYYNRTMIGYFDTDMLNIVFPTFLLWSLILAIKTHEEKYLLFTALEIVAYRWWYPQSYSLEFAFFGLILFYVLVFERKNLYMYKLLSIMLFAMMGLPGVVRFITVIGVYLLYKNKKIDSYIYYLFGFAFLLFMFTGGFSPIWAQLKGYVFKDTVKVMGEDLQLHFFSVMQTVREAGKIPFETFANRISGHTITFILSIIGYILLVFRRRVILLGLPMIGLGFLAYVGGLRFTIYAVPMMAFGISYLIFTCSDYLKKFLANEQSSFYIRTLFIVVCTLAVLYPNLIHIINYKVPTVMNKQEVTVLDKLKNIANREDYVVAWWDYGYPIRYYSNVDTLIDGGKHSGSVNFPVSYMLTNSQQSSAKLARLDVEYTEQRFLMEINNQDRNRTNIANMTLDNGFQDANDFLISLSTNIKLPKKTRDIYFYLPFRMLGIFPTVAKFSDIDLMSGKMKRRPFIYQTNRFKDSKEVLNLDRGILFNKKSGILQIGNQEVPVKEFLITAYDKNKKLIRQRQSIHKDGNLYLVYMRSYNTFLVLDEDMINSTYIQLFVFENYDKNLFEPVILDPSAKVYKLKI